MGPRSLAPWTPALVTLAVVVAASLVVGRGEPRPIRSDPPPAPSGSPPPPRVLERARFVIGPAGGDTTAPGAVLPVDRPCPGCLVLAAIDAETGRVTHAMSIEGEGASGVLAGVAVTVEPVEGGVEVRLSSPHRTMCGTGGSVVIGREYRLRVPTGERVEATCIVAAG